MESMPALGEEVQAPQDYFAKFPIDTVSASESDEKLIQERLEVSRTIIAGNLEGGFTRMPDLVRQDSTLSRSAKLVCQRPQA